VPLWAAQGLGQDWVDLLLVAPLLVVTAGLTLKGSRVAVLLLAGTCTYALYSMVLYAFFVHFGPLFLAYAWGLGLAFYGVVTLASALGADDVEGWFDVGAPVRVSGWYCVALGALFCALWMSEVLPALAAGTPPGSAEAAGLITNPVEVLDLGIVLPAFIVGGVALVRRRRLGYWLVPAMLAFGVVMDVALVGMVLSMNARGLGDGGGPPLPVFLAMTVVTAGVLVWLLRHVQPIDREDRR